MDTKKKKILFINRYFHVGGIQSSLINMANALCENYDIEMLVFYPEQGRVVAYHSFGGGELISYLDLVAKSETIHP